MLFIFFCLAAVFSFLLPAVAPSLNLMFFAPALILSYYKKSLISCLWISLCCGLSLDLLAADQRLGLQALNYCFVTWLLYDQKRNFFEDSLSAIPVMTLFFSVISTGLQAVLLFIFEKGLPLSLDWMMTDLVVMPLCDALYGFVCFTLPLSIRTIGKARNA